MMVIDAGAVYCELAAGVVMEIAGGSSGRVAAMTFTESSVAVAATELL